MSYLRGALVLAVWACTGTSGTVKVELATAPGSHVLDAALRLRLTITQPRQVTEAARTPAGFEVVLDVPATGGSGALIVEGLDASGALVACGQSPVFPVAAINASIVVYMAPPRSIELAPAALEVPQSQVSGTSIGYGIVLAGGRDAAGAPSSTIAIYNAYDHSLVRGIPLPAPRSGLAVAAGGSGAVYLFGGTGPDGQPAGTLWRFDTTVPPNGAYAMVTDQAAFARTDQSMVPVGSDRFLITGAPPLALSGSSLTPRTDIAALPAVGAAVVPADGIPTAIFAGPQLVRFRGDAFDTLDGNGSGGGDAVAAALPDGRVVMIGGGDPAPSRAALVIDGATGMVTVIPDALATPRAHPSLAATSRHLVIAGGTDPSGAPIATAEVLDAATLAPIATLPILARTGAFAAALSNDQVMLVGGTPASAQIELFTPEPPALQGLQGLRGP
jgi:hypothetical protein